MARYSGSGWRVSKFEDGSHYHVKKAWRYVRNLGPNNGESLAVGDLTNLGRIDSMHVDGENLIVNARSSKSTLTSMLNGLFYVQKVKEISEVCDE